MERKTVNRELELPGKIILTWFVSGGIMTGGWFVLYGLFRQVVAHYMLFQFIGGLYLVGGFLGFLAGGALGMFGRPFGMDVFDAFKDQLKGSLYLLIFGAIGFVAAGWIVLTYWSAVTGSLLGLFFAGTGWLVGGLFLAFAVEYGWFGLKNLAGRVVKIGKIHIHIHIEDK